MHAQYVDHSIITRDVQDCQQMSWDVPDPLTITLPQIPTQTLTQDIPGLLLYSEKLW